jgi:hypothetical protein
MWARWGYRPAVNREPVNLTRLEAARILAAGAAVGRDPGAIVLACPYSAAGDATQRVRVAAWVRGFLSVRHHEMATTGRCSETPTDCR